MTKDDAADATFGGCFLLLIFGLISWAVGLVFYAVSMVVALGRSVQLYVYAAFSPIPISLLGFEETKQIGIGYLKNFAAAALAGVVMVLILYLYPHLVTALAVSGGLGKAEMLGLAQGVETFDSFGVIIKTITVLIHDHDGACKVRLLGEGNPRRVDAYRKPATAHRRGVPKPVRPFPLISYYGGEDLRDSRLPRSPRVRYEGGGEVLSAFGEGERVFHVVVWGNGVPFPVRKTLTKYEDEVNTLVEKAASERAARYAYDHPKLPKGFVTITQLQGGLRHPARCGRWRLFPFGGSERSRPIALRSPGEQESRPRCDSETE